MTTTLLFTYPLSHEAVAAFTEAAGDLPVRLLHPDVGTPDDWRMHLSQADVLVINKASVTQADLRAASRLTQVHIYPSAPVGFPLADCTVAVYTVPQPALLGVAEHTLLLMLALAKQLLPSERRLRAGDRVFEPIKTSQSKIGFNWLGLDNYGMIWGKTLGLIGLGSIALDVVRRARAFDMEVIYFKRTRLSPGEEADLGVSYRPYDQLLAQSDFVSLHHRIVDGTKPMGQADFQKMKRTAYLINTARGPLINEAELYAALRDGTISGAGLDVFEYEPLHMDNPLLSLDNVVLTPHTAGIPNAVSLQVEARAILKMIRSSQDRG